MWVLKQCGLGVKWRQRLMKVWIFGTIWNTPKKQVWKRDYSAPCLIHPHIYHCSLYCIHFYLCIFVFYTFIYYSALFFFLFSNFPNSTHFNNSFTEFFFFFNHENNSPKYMATSKAWKHVWIYYKINSYFCISYIFIFLCDTTFSPFNQGNIFVSTLRNELVIVFF
jgi:hypothetical protein